MTGLRFHSPLWLPMLIPLLGIGWLAIRRARLAALTYSSVTLLHELPVTIALRLKRLLPWLRIAGMALIVVALSRPQQGREEFRIRTEGIAIQMCLDRSGSMQAMDFTIDTEHVNRLEAVKRVFEQFVTGGTELAGRTDDLIGLVSFGGFAEAICPQTLDHGALLEVLETVAISEPVRDQSGRIVNEQLWREENQTAIGDAVALAVDRLRDAKQKSRVIILLSDGENTAGVVSPAEAAEAARSFGIRIYAIGVGSTGMAPFPAQDLFGRTILQAQPVRLDEQTLTMLAESTDGKYFNARDTAALEQVYAEIDQLERTETEGTLYTEYRELFGWLMLPGLFCILFEVVLSSTRFRALP